MEEESSEDDALAVEDGPTLVERDVEASRTSSVLDRPTNLSPPPFRGVVLRVDLDILPVVGNTLPPSKT